MWKNPVEPDRPPMTIWCMHIACWIPRVTDTHSKFVIIIAFPMQQWLHKCVSMLHYVYSYMVLYTSLHFTTPKITVQTSTIVKTHISYEWNEVDNMHTTQIVHFKHHADSSIFGIISAVYVMKCCNILFWNILNVLIIYWSIFKILFSLEKSRSLMSHILPKSFPGWEM